MLLAFFLPLIPALVMGQIDDDFEPITNDDCVGCHETSDHGTEYDKDLAHSVHDGLECLDCHADTDTYPHRVGHDIAVGCDACRTCHEEAAAEYQGHGRALVGTCEDMPQCADCHGDHDILPSDVKASKTHPLNLPQTCGRCHEDLDLTRKYDILIDHPIEIYETSVHGQATKGGVYTAATCNDCHSTAGSAHRILSPGQAESAINHFKIPDTCGRCHNAIAKDFWEGIHGKLVARGETDAPVCTHCHGEHGIISPSDSRSPVSRSRVAQETCSPCHESAILNEKYGRRPGRLTTFIDSYHGLKSKAGDPLVANCASCHGVHRILPSSDPSSTINPANLQHTCGECHPGISAELAAAPIHGIGENGLRTRAADIVETIYIVAIIIIIGLMVVHWIIDLSRQIHRQLTRRPQIQRMRLHEVWQHTFLMISFIVLVISGFALRYSEGFLTRIFFGWEGGSEVRGIVHRTAAVLFMLTTIWHSLFVMTTRRGRGFVRDMWPVRQDFLQFVQKILYDIRGRGRHVQFKRFSYVEKAEYWALVWGTVVMILTGLLLWFDNWFVHYLPKGVLDVGLVIHYWEAWLASLAILVWHMYATVFSPHVYPMNPSWITGRMPEEMYMVEHPAHLKEARRETEEYVQQQLAHLTDDGHDWD